MSNRFYLASIFRDLLTAVGGLERRAKQHCGKSISYSTSERHEVARARSEDVWELSAAGKGCCCVTRVERTLLSRLFFSETNLSLESLQT